jgi:hypothetical protein
VRAEAGATTDRDRQWLFLQADRRYAAAFDILAHLSSPGVSDLAPIPPAEPPSLLVAPASLAADVDNFFATATAATTPGTASWLGGDYQDEIVRLLYNWANLRRAWAATGANGGDDEVRARRRTNLLEASLALYQLCVPAIERWTAIDATDNDAAKPKIASTNKEKTSSTSLLEVSANGGGGHDETWSKGQEDLRATGNSISTWHSELKVKKAEDDKTAAANHQRTTKRTREEKEARDHRRRAAQVLANWGVTLVELGRSASVAVTAASPTPVPITKAQARWWSEAKAKLAAAEAVETGVGAYNLGCVAALEGNADDSRQWLEKCQRYGRGPALELWSGDEDLASVRDQGWFKALLSQPLLSSSSSP